MSQTPYNCDDCTETYNPKLNGLNGLQRKACEAFGDYICDPVADEIRDYERAKNMAYTRFPIVPFFDGADATLRFFRKMKEQSPTHGACIDRIGVYTFGEGLSVMKKKRPGFVLKSNDLTVEDAEAEKFIDFIEGLNPGFDGDQLLNQMWKTHENLKTYGNYFIRVDMVTVAGVKFCFPTVIDCEDVRYKLTKKGEQKVLLVSPLWTWDYLHRNLPEFLPVYPAIEKTGDGMLTTVIHVKNEVVSRSWYGMPDSFQSLRHQLIEAQQGQYYTENYANDFIPRTIIEIEDTNKGMPTSAQNDGFDQAIKATYTNVATEKKRVVIRRRLPDEKPMTVHEVQSSSDYKEHTVMSLEAEKQICKSHGFNKILLGESTAGKLGANQEFRDIYRQTNFTTIRPYRQDLLSGWHKALKICDEFLNGKQTITGELSINFSDLFEDYLQAIIQEEKGNGVNGIA